MRSRTWQVILTPLLLVTILLAVWVGMLAAFQVSPLIGARPWTVAQWLSTADNGSSTLTLLAATARDSAIGFAAGLGLSLIIASLFSMFSVVDRSVAPILVVIRVVPLVVLTPVLTLLFGGGLGGVTATVCIVVFFPALSLITAGLQSAPAELLDLVAVNGGRRLAELWYVKLRTALPSLAGAATLTLPAAVTGATIAEWLVTGDGLGGAMSRSAGAFLFVPVWSYAAVLTGTTVLAYVVLGAIRSLLTRGAGQ